MRVCAHLLLVVVLAVALGCDQSVTSAQAQPAVSASVQSGPITVAVGIDQDRIQTVDRVALSVEVTIEAGRRVERVDIAADSAGWTLISQTRSPAKLLADGRVRVVIESILEPFLAGQYTTPGIEVSWTSASHGRGVVIGPTLDIGVASVLGDDDALTIDPARPIAASPELAVAIDRRAVTLAVIGAVLAGGAVVVSVVLIAGRMIRRRREPDLHAELRRIALNGPTTDEPSLELEYAVRAAAEAAFGLPTQCMDRGEFAAAALRAGLDPDRASTVDEVLARCEAVRFGHRRDEPKQVQQDAAEAQAALEATA